MATQPINFKRVGTPSYRTYRVLQARGDWGQIYRERVATCGDLHGAIIFPEQLFTLSQANIYAASATPLPTGVGGMVGLNLTVKPFSDIGVYDGVNQVRLTRSEQVLEYEENHFDKEGVRQLYIGTSYYRSDMPAFGHQQTLFTNKDSAARWLEKQARDNLRKMIP